MSDRVLRSAVIAILVLCTALGTLRSLGAQEQAAPLAAPPAPYDEGLFRLAEILGAVHYLRDLCGSAEGSLWRDQMQGIIDAEEAEGERLARFVDGFNRGYDGFRSVYRTCTPAATLAVDRYLREGARIARDIAARYGREE
jgi:uncharacterized protein (TIGR02301 family)